MFRTSHGPILVGGCGADAVVVPELFVIIVRTFGNSAGDGMRVCFPYVAEELVEGAISLGRNIFRHPVANPTDDRDVVRGWISLLFFTENEEEDLIPFAPGERLRRLARSMTCDPIRFRVQSDPTGVLWFASPDEPIDIRVGLAPLAVCSRLLSLADAVCVNLVLVGRRGLNGLVVRCLAVIGTRDDPGVKTAAVFVPHTVPIVIPGAKTSVGVCPANRTSASVNFKRLVAAGTCDPGLLFVGRAFRYYGFFYLAI